MMILVDKVALEKRARDVIGNEAGYKAWAVMDEISNAKMIDAVPIVRCGECVHFQPNNAEEGDRSGVCQKIGLLCDITWFCADGEREG